MTVDFLFAGLPPVNCCILSLKLIECSSWRKRDGVELSLLSSSVSFLSFKPLRLKEDGTHLLVRTVMLWLLRPGSSPFNARISDKGVDVESL